MAERDPVVRGKAALAVLVAILGLLAAGEAGVAPDQSADKAADQNALSPADAPPARAFKNETVRGKVVWLDEALKRLYGVATHPDAAESEVVLETLDGQLLPLVPDTRGRAFVLDERLRNTELELFVRRYQGVPMLQVIRVFRVKPDGRYEIDYWCDVCAISMYILKSCECCQGPIRLRETHVEPGS